MKINAYFLGEKKKKTISNLMSAELAGSVIEVKTYPYMVLSEVFEQTDLD